MSSLVAPRPPQWRRMHEEDDRQGSLFGGEAFSPPPAMRRPEPPRDEVGQPPAEKVLAPGEANAPTRDFVAPEEGGEIRVSRGSAVPLAGPTLDDVVTHAWEGLGAGVPAACPVCHGEIEPVLGGGLQGRCGSCGASLD